jgi:hypothetical protein
MWITSLFQAASIQESAWPSPPPCDLRRHFSAWKDKFGCLSPKCVVNFHIVALVNSLQALCGPLDVDFIDENQEDDETIR